MQLELEMANLSLDAREGMQSDIAQMDAIIGQFLDYAKPTEASSFVPVEISHLLADCAQHATRLPGMRVTTDLEEDVQVLGNETDLRRVINNVVENARRYARTPGSDAGGGPGTWTAAPLLARRPLWKTALFPALRPLFDATVWTDVAPNLEPPAEADGPPTVRGTLGALYLGTIGEASDAAVDTLWWFDGTGSWHPTGLRNHARGVPAPVSGSATLVR